MNLLIVGINHNSAPVALREKVAFTPDQLADALHDLSLHAGLSEVAILSTCNRTEIIATTAGVDTGEVVAWLASYHQMPIADLAPSIYIRLNRDATQHAMRVACGLDSMIVGEPQILGQFKDCFAQARRSGTLGSELHHLSQASFRIAKKVRTETAIGENSVSVASTAVILAGQLFSDLSHCKVLLIGAGDTIALVGRHVRKAGMINLTIANRTLENARRLADELNAEAIDLQTIPRKLADTDIVIAATASQLPVLGKGAVERALKSRKHKPILMVDLAVPRDIEPEVAELADIYLYSIDELQQIIEGNLSNRREEALAAEAMIEAEAAAYRSRQEVRAADEILIRFRQHHDGIKQEELGKALTRLSAGADPEQVLNQLANQLTNKIMHTPSSQLKNALAEDEDPFLAAISRLYQLDGKGE